MSDGPRGLVWSGKRRVLLGLGVGLVASLLLTLLRPTAPVEGAELQLIDVRTRAYVGTRPPDERLTLLMIGDQDLEFLKQRDAALWPWPLDYNRQIAQVAKASGAIGFVVDVLHLDRGTSIEEHPAPDTLTGMQQSMLEEEAYYAGAYGKAVSEFQHKALVYELTNTATYNYPARRETAMGPSTMPGLPAIEEPALARTQADLPVLALLKRKLPLGFANTATDPDGQVRRAPLLARWGSRRVPSLPMVMFRSLAPKADLPPHMADGTFLLNFRGPAGRTYPVVTARQVLEWFDEVKQDRVPDAARRAFEGRIVVFGISIGGARDIVSTAIGKTQLGTEYQATALDNMLHGDGRLRVPSWVNVLILLGLLSLAGVWMGARRHPLIALLGPVVLGVLLIGLSFPLFRGGWSIDLFTPLIGLLLTAVGTTTLWRFTEGRYNRWLEGTFGRYLAPSIIETLKKDPTRLNLGGHTRELSIVFTDVAKFTTISEGLESKQLVHLLNKYLTLHCAPVLDQEGVVDKFEGDAVMAFFGDPLDMPDHAVRACRACLKVQADLPSLEPTLRELGIESFHVRMGINSGPATVGNMGSSTRFDYTCMGDSVNLASRLEGANKAFGTSILLGAKTYELAAEHIYAKPLGGLLVVGKTVPVQVYELLGMRERPDPRLEAHIQAFEEALAAARRGDTTAAEVAIAKAEAERPGDPACWWLRSVLREHPTGWQGTTSLTSK